MKKQVKKGAKVNNSSKASKGKQVAKAKVTINKAKVSKVILAKVEKSKDFDITKASSFDRILQASRKTTLVNMSLSKAFSNYLQQAKEILTPKQMKVLTMKSVIIHLNNSVKYGSLELFSVHQVALICNEILKANDLNTKRSAKVDRQNKLIAKK